MVSAVISAGCSGVSPDGESNTVRSAWTHIFSQCQEDNGKAGKTYRFPTSEISFG